MGQTSTPRKKIWVGASQWSKIRATIRKEAIGYVTKAVFAALIATLLFSLHRVETDLPPLLQASRLNTSITSFVASAHSVAVAEMEFLRTVQEVDCNSQYVDNDAEYVLNGGNFDISAACTPRILTSHDLFIRGALLDAITLYADSLAAMAVRGSYQGLDPDSRNLATRLASLAKSGALGFGSNTSINTALSRIYSFALDSSQFSSPEAAATAIGPNLYKIVEMLEDDNAGLAQEILSRNGLTEVGLRAVLLQLKSQRGTESFFNILEARRILQETNQVGPIQLSKTQDEPNKTQDDLNSDLDPNSDQDIMNYAEQVNAALDAISNTNAAIASAHVSAIDAALATLIEKTQEAQSASPSSQQRSP